MQRALLEGATFKRSKFTGVDFSDARGVNVHFEETLLINTKLVGRSFRKATLARIDFSQSDLRKCDFRMASFEDCSLRETLVAEARFDGADLRGADLGGLRLDDASRFRGATISREQAAQLLSELGLKVR
jgi:fluoroquinolone resistance protein